jgi:hypothetical protein
MDEKTKDGGIRGESPAATPAGEGACKDVSPCPLCGLEVPMTELRCPRCHALLVTACSGACASCGARTCLRPDDSD